jgi:hypothetical protein
MSGKVCRRLRNATSTNERPDAMRWAFRLAEAALDASRSPLERRVHTARRGLFWFVLVLWAVTAAAARRRAGAFRGLRAVIYARRASPGSSLGVTMIACRHRDAVPRVSRSVLRPCRTVLSTFGTSRLTADPGREKVVFVTDGLPFVGGTC